MLFANVHKNFLKQIRVRSQDTEHRVKEVDNVLPVNKDSHSVQAMSVNHLLNIESENWLNRGIHLE